MAFQQSMGVRNARLDAIEQFIGAGAILKIRTGAHPANTAAADTGTVLATLALPSDWLLPAANAVKAKSGTWSDASADASGTPGHYRIYGADGITCHLHGSCGIAGSGAQMILSQATVALGQIFTIDDYQILAGNA